MSSTETCQIYPSLQVSDGGGVRLVPQYNTYPGRYYVLIVTALLCMQQNIAWLTFGPIPEEAKDKYGLTDIEITLLPGRVRIQIIM